MDGDGYDDVLVRIIGRYQESTPDSRYYLYRGSAQGLRSLHDRVIAASYNGAYFDTLWEAMTSTETEGPTCSLKKISMGQAIVFSVSSTGKPPRPISPANLPLR